MMPGMTIVLIALGVAGIAFVAFCLWLTVRIINRQKRPGWKFWTTAILCALVLYELSGTPAELLVIRLGEPGWIMVPGRVFYAPSAWLQNNGPEWWRQWNYAYDQWWQKIIVPDDEGDEEEAGEWNRAVNSPARKTDSPF
jgi:hypothetical protein